MNEYPQMHSRLSKNLPIALGVLVLGVVLSLVSIASGGADGMKHFFQGYLFSFIFWFSLTLGCFAVTLLHHTVRGTWGYGIQRIYEAGGGPFMLIVMLVLWAPLLGALKMLYPWADPAKIAADPILQHKTRFFLGTGFYVGETLFIFVIWIVFALFMQNSVRRQEQTSDFSQIQKRMNTGAGGLVFLVLSATLLFTQWVMSLDAHWYSTVFGVWNLIGAALAAFAFATILVMRWHKEEPYSAFANPKQNRFMRDMGNLMLAFTMLWAYLSLSQYLIIWSGNLPEEISYYYRRSNGGTISPWNIMGTLLLIGQFFAPFLMLLSSRAKRTPSLLIKVAAWIFFFHVVDVYWTITPFFYEQGNELPVGTYLAQAGTFLAIGGLWYALFIWRLKQSPLLPLHEPRLEEALQNA